MMAMKRTPLAVITDTLSDIAQEDIDLEVPAALRILENLRAEGYVIAVVV